MRLYGQGGPRRAAGLDIERELFRQFGVANGSGKSLHVILDTPEYR